MTKRETPNTVPVIELYETRDKESFEDFCDKLLVFADQWVSEVAVPIMRSADKLYDEAAIVILVDKWHELNESVQREERERLMRAAKHDEYSWETEGELEEFATSFYRGQCNAFSDALYMLLIG